MPTFEIENDSKVTEDRRVFQGMKLPPAKIDTTMHAFRLHAPGGPASLKYEQIDTPRPGAGGALVRIYAAAITRDELKWPVDRRPAIPSYEFSGIVAAVGAETDDLEIGESVYALKPEYFAALTQAAVLFGVRKQRKLAVF